MKEYNLTAILWLHLCYSHSADALASVDESEGRGDTFDPRKGSVGVRTFNMAGKGVAVTAWDDG